MSLDQLDPDFAMGGSYKYVRGGPGAGWLWLSPRTLGDRELNTLDTGWFAKREPFGYARPDHPDRATGADGWRESTPPVLAAYQALAGLEIALEIGVARQREYLLGLMARLREALQEAGLSPHLPIEPSRFGGFVLLPHPNASGFASDLRAVGVNVDARGGFVRFGPDILTTEAEFLELPNRISRAR